MRPPETTRAPCRHMPRQKASSEHLHKPEPAEVVDQAGGIDHRRHAGTTPPDGVCHAGEVPRHPRGQVPRRPRAVRTPARGTPPLPRPEALWPLARALVALALEVRAEDLAPGQKKRPHLPSGKGGCPCAA